MTNVDGIVLVMTESRRSGQPKCLAEWRGRPLIAHVVETAVASRLRRVIVVLGPQADRVRAALQPIRAHSKVKLVYNPEYDEGRASFIRRGVNALPEDAGAAVFLSGDQPLVNAHLIDALIEAFERHRALICYPVFGVIRGNPSIFAASLFPELRKLSGDAGSATLIEKYKSRVHEHRL